MFTNFQHVTRFHFIKKLNNLPAGSHLYIGAPAGFGKTVALNQWLVQGKHRYHTISLDKIDNEMESFLGHFIAALCRIQPENTVIKAISAVPSFLQQPLHDTLQVIQSLEEGPPEYIILDNMHCISNSQILNTIPILFNRLPASIRIIIVSRRKIPDYLFYFYITGKLILIDSSELKFTRQEVEQCCRIHKSETTPRQVSDILERTNGWPIAIITHLHSLHTGSSSPDLFTCFLQTEVLGEWDAATQFFLIQTAIVKELSPALCQALLQNPDAGQLLENFYRISPLLLKQPNGNYTLLPLFRKFLLCHAKSKGERCLNDKKAIAAGWYLRNGDFLQAALFYCQCGRYHKGVECLYLAEKSSLDLACHEVLPEILKALPAGIEKDHPVLSYLMAFHSFCLGEGEAALRHMDFYYLNYQKIFKQAPELAHKILLLQLIDYRIPLHRLIHSIRLITARENTRPVDSSITLGMPLLHRSFRDFAACIYHLDVLVKNSREQAETAAALFGSPYNMIIHTLTAGIHYEKGDLVKAEADIMAGYAAIRDSFCPRYRFPLYVLQIDLFDAIGSAKRAASAAQELAIMMQDENAACLKENYDAVITRRMLASGISSAASSWLKKHPYSQYNHVTLTKIYPYLVTARAFISLGEFEEAIILLMKISTVSSNYNRTLDLIESNLLLAIAYWGKKGFQKEAFKSLEKAMSLALPSKCTQIFVSETSALYVIVCKLLHRHRISRNKSQALYHFIQQVYLLMTSKAGLSADYARPAGSQSKTGFTARQLQVMKHLCDGKSYRQIGEAIGIKTTTVRSHIELIYRKLDVPNMEAAIRKIRALEILESDS